MADFDDRLAKLRWIDEKKNKFQTSRTTQLLPY
jgi:hypothetical protein